uniref:Uncharacterized protein n=1 Tax=Trieres chinensis TaxID=1514140 RepID=A0A7S2A2Q3_TRICV
MFVKVGSSPENGNAFLPIGVVPQATIKGSEREKARKESCRGFRRTETRRVRQLHSTPLMRFCFMPIDEQEKGGEAAFPPSKLEAYRRALLPPGAIQIPPSRPAFPPPFYSSLFGGQLLSKKFVSSPNRCLVVPAPSLMEWLRLG